MTDCDLPTRRETGDGSPAHAPAYCPGVLLGCDAGRGTPGWGRARDSMSQGDRAFLGFSGSSTKEQRAAREKNSWRTHLTHVGEFPILLISKEQLFVLVTLLSVSLSSFFCLTNFLIKGLNRNILGFKFIWSVPQLPALLL